MSTRIVTTAPAKMQLPHQAHLQRDLKANSSSLLTRPSQIQCSSLQVLKMESSILVNRWSRNSLSNTVLQCNKPGSRVERLPPVLTLHKILQLSQEESLPREQAQNRRQYNSLLIFLTMDSKIFSKLQTNWRVANPSLASSTSLISRSLSKSTKKKRRKH
jgi:hypothetical protein